MEERFARAENLAVLYVTRYPIDAIVSQCFFASFGLSLAVGGSAFGAVEAAFCASAGSASSSLLVNEGLSLHMAACLRCMTPFVAFGTSDVVTHQVALS
jgi:hypothetical protein